MTLPVCVKPSPEVPRAVVMTVSGFTVLPWNYDAAVAAPSITQLVNAADQTSPVAPGGLIPAAVSLAS